jgi:RNA-directed DNA polymerase
MSNQFEFFSKYLLDRKHVSDLKIIFNKDSEAIFRLISKPQYKRFFIAKKDGTKRIILAPDTELKKAQTLLSNILQNIYLEHRPDYVYGFIPNYKNQSVSVVSNAANHVQKKFLLNADVQDFFPSITSRMVKEMFENTLNLPEQLSSALALLVTYQGKLPQGSPASPVISNLVFLKTDKAIKDFCNDFKITYTRYADDLSFSTNIDSFENQYPFFLSEIKNILKKDGYSVNEKKVFFRTQKQRMKVTGIKVNEKLNVDTAYRKQTRAMRHDLKKNGLRKAATNYFAKWRPGEMVSGKLFIEILRGREAWEREVRRGRGIKKF